MSDKFKETNTKIVHTAIAMAWSIKKSCFS